MRIAGHDIGVCTWSLRQRSLADTLAAIKSLGLEHLQVALAPMLAHGEHRLREELAMLGGSGLSVTAGMIAFAGEDYTSIATIRQTGGFVPDTPWDERRALMLAGAELARRMNLTMVSTHAGFIPPSNHPHYQTLIARVREIGTAMGDLGLRLLMETGQEQAPELLQFLNDLALANVAVNFDPANMILYGAGDPIDAIATLGRHIAHVHLKDAVLSDQPGVRWGEEVPWGSGQVDPVHFLEALDAAGYAGPLVIEREAGRDRPADVRAAIAALESAAAQLG
jgi:sugar phosphate isomerase/epimerase